MLTKILVTALVILGCYFYLRFKRSRNLSQPAPRATVAESRAPSRSPVRLLALGLCLLSVLSSAAYLGSSWLDGRTLLQVRVINANSGEVVEYQAYKSDVEGRGFITIYGQRVSIASTERMEISEVRAR
jgi:hypothetical protein